MNVTQVNTIHAVRFWSQLRNSKLRKPQSFLRGYKKNLKSLQMVIAAMKLKDAYSLEGKL